MTSTPYSETDAQRWLTEGRESGHADRSDFARDRARVLHSAGLRRLALTTQVVQPGSDDFVRNRLTHSLEVAQIGRELGSALGCDPDIVDTAGLAHDLGHPPFGHHGETILDELSQDIGGFEGNAQTLRVLTRLEAKRLHPNGESAGLNLTRASLDAVIKYPWARGDVVGSAKFGYYADDRDVYNWVRPRHGGGEQSGTQQRCVEAQIMDWSDDVAYCVHDVEDAVTSGRIDLRTLRDADEQTQIVDLAIRWYVPDFSPALLQEQLQLLLATEWIPQAHEPTRVGLAALKSMTSRLVGHFVRGVHDATREQAGSGPLTRYDADVIIPDEVRAQTAVLKAAAAHYVMLSEERRQIMAHQTDVMRDLVEHFAAQPESMDVIHADARRKAQENGDDTAVRRSVIDQVASLSDLRALGIHQMLST